jgi:histidine triad (HIT) family protein
MSDCEFCGIVQGEFDSEELYSDDLLHLKPAAPGQVLIFTKEHYPIIEQVPDDVVGHVFSIANKLSAVLFETLGVEGTNIIIENGVAAGQAVPHFAVNIIPRKEGDGLELMWNPTKPGEEEMEIAHTQLIEQAHAISSSEKTEVVAEKEEHKEEKMGEDDYRIKQLRRIP